MELYSKNLFNYIAKFNFPPFDLCQEILYKLLKGLSYIHKLGIMHRDLKLQNIMMRGEDQLNVEPVIVDFGIA
jgi:serine/threonine protein kinase